MRQIQDQQYTQFTPKERVNLTVAALSRGDETEASRLWQTCPRHRYDAYDFEYTLCVDALMVLSMHFFQKCILHYNLIKRADILSMSLEEDLEFEERKKFNDFANQTRKAIELIKKAHDLHLSQIKGLFEGFKQFCSAVGVDSEHLLRTIPIKECCHDLDILLVTDLEIDIQYAARTKNYFLEHWNF